MELIIELKNINFQNNFRVYYKIGNTHGTNTHIDGYTLLNGTYTPQTNLLNINVLNINNNPYGKQFWFKIVDTVTQDYIIKNIWVHEEIFYQRLCDPTPTPEPTPTLTPEPTTTPSPTPTITPTQTPTLPEQIVCNVGDTLFFSGNYSNNDLHMYPPIFISSTSASCNQFNWSVLDRPNRFTIYDSTGLIYTTGWVGVANYSGPWGSSLSTSSTGSFNFEFQSISNRYILVETGPSDPISPITDAYEITLICQNCVTPEPTTNEFRELTAGVEGTVFVTGSTYSLFLSGSPFGMTPNPATQNSDPGGCNGCKSKINFFDGSTSSASTISFTLSGTANATVFTNLTITDGVQDYVATFTGGSPTGQNVVVSFNIGTQKGRIFRFVGGEINLQFS